VNGFIKSLYKEIIMNSKALIAEGIGTFALVFLGAGAAAIGIGGLVGVALAHGITVMVFAYAFGSISGSHINPAVTFAMALSGKLTWNETISYWVAQLFGAIAAAGTLFYVLGGSQSGLGATIPANGVSIGQTIVLEAILTFFLVNTITRTTASKENSGWAPIAIGATLVAAILMGGPLTGASLNPARTFGPAFYTGSLDVFWVYLLGTFAGAGAAAGLNRWLSN
jgi:aquaporin Z